MIVVLFFLSSLCVGNAQAANNSPCEKALLSLMWEDINNAIAKQYDFGVSIWNEKIVQLQMQNGLTFQITIQGDVYVGAHNTFGTDTITFEREIDGLKLVSYKHTPSKDKQEILDWYFKHSAQPKPKQAK
ncbi:DUF3888 domain-containing protein [Bacillus rubiinfantis]|uniref:DUF3888 domain-containing protein n=1 Tax=Bacillus rubiinfantis TaxID=1499680 RepID=UPI001FEB3045|nr:DUF3888 domain-containing protein [Bacillus rubiinfantis]